MEIIIRSSRERNIKKEKRRNFFINLRNVLPPEVEINEFEITKIKIDSES